MRRTSAVLFLFVALALTLGSQAPAVAQPTFSKAFNPSTIGPGSVSTLRFDITNPSGSAVADMAFVDNLPAGITIASPSAAQSTCGGTLSAPEGGGTIVFSGGTVGVAGSCFVRVNVTSSTVGVHTNVSGSLTSNVGSSGTATADLTVATDRPGFSKSFSPSTVAFGGRSRLTFTIDNSQTGAAVSFATFTDNLPTGMTVASPANTSNTCGGTVTAASGSSSVAYSGNGFPLLAAGAVCAIGVDVVGGAVGPMGNVSGELTVALGGPTRSSGKASATLTGTQDPIAIVKRFLGDPVPPTATVALQFQIFNVDRSDDATDIEFTDDLDAVIAGMTATGLPASDVCGVGSQVAVDGAGVLSLTGGTLPAEGSCTFTVDVVVPAGAADGVYVNTTSAVTGTVDGLPVTGGTATDDLFVVAAPILTQTFVGDPVGAGGSIDLEFSIFNPASSAATDIAFEESFVVELPTASSVPATGFCGPGSTAVFTPLIPVTMGSAVPAKLEISDASLDPGASCDFSLTLDVLPEAATGGYLNTTSEITATVDGVTVSGAPAADEFLVVSPPRFRKAFIDDPVQAGDTVTLRFTISNNQGGRTDPVGDSSNIGFTDNLTATLSGLEAVGLPASDVCGTGSEISGTTLLTLTGGNLAAGEACSFDVTLQTPAAAEPGTYPNATSNLTADMGDTSPVSTVGNRAEDSLRIAGLTLTKEFTDDPALPGGTVNLRFVIANSATAPAASSITFSDDLDDTLAGLVATGLPLADPCGAGSSLVGLSGDSLLRLTGGSLGAGESCAIDVTLSVPAGALTGTYQNVANAFSALVGGSPVSFENAVDELEINSEQLGLSKEFIDDPVAPGDTVVLRFTIDNLNPSQAVADLAFTDDLGAALSGLEAIALPADGFCGAGSQLTGTGVLTLSGGSLAAGGSCTFDVTLQVPADVDLGTVGTNTTSEITGSLGGLVVDGPPATDDLAIEFVTFSKVFDDPVEFGDSVELTFMLMNLSATETVAALTFSDDLGAVAPGLEAVGLPQLDVCGPGSSIDGTSVLTFQSGSLPPGGSCTIVVEVAVPDTVAPGDYLNTTSPLREVGGQLEVPAASDTLTVIVPIDADEDGVDDVNDACLGTVIPEGVPTERLGVNRFALVDDDTIFDTTAPKGNGKAYGPRRSYTIADTAGCSCEQIIAAQGLGEGHVKFGCSISAMDDWIAGLDAYFASGANLWTPPTCELGECDEQAAPVGPTLTLVVRGPGDVSTSPRLGGPQAVCGGGRCAAPIEEGETIVLFARPVGANSVFLGWSGACAGNEPITTAVVRDGDVCEARFGNRKNQ